MDSDSFIQVLVFLFSLSFAMLLSGAETFFSSLPGPSLERMKNEGIKYADKILAISHPRNKFHLSLLFGKTLAGLVAMVVSFLLAETICQAIGLHRIVGFVGATLTVLLSLLYSEIFLSQKILPSIEETFPKKLALFTYLAYITLLPLTNLFYRFLPEEKEYREMKEAELKNIVESEREEGVIKEKQGEMIRHILELSDTTAKEIMIPRIDMVCAQESMKGKELVKVIEEAGHSRIPIYSEKRDNITGVVYAKDLLQAITISPDLTLKEIARGAYFIPENKKLDDLLREFQAKKIHMAIIVDEYGGTAGLVTLEDLLEEIVGEIRDEYDVEEELYKWIDDGMAIVDAKIDIHDLNEIFNTDLPRDGFETLAGFIYNSLGRVPEKNESLKFKNLQMKIEQVNGQRISKVRVLKKPVKQEA